MKQSQKTKYERPFLSFSSLVSDIEPEKAKNDLMLTYPLVQQLEISKLMSSFRDVPMRQNNYHDATR